MAHYSIKDLEKLSGIHAHTIRIWEKRYQLVKPMRTATNIRVYSDEDLKRLLNVAVLNKNGLKISKIARLNDNDLNNKIIQLSSDMSNTDSQIESLVIGMIELDEEKFEHLIQKLVDEIGFENTIVKIVYPFLVKIGVLWQTGNIQPAQEHFVSNIIRKKLFTAIDELGASKKNSKYKFLLFLPEGEFHEISLLFYAYLVKKQGYNGIYLGQSVPFTDLESIQKTYNADFMVTSLVTNLQDITVVDYIKKLSKAFKKNKLYIAGQLVANVDIKRGSNVVKLKSPEHFKELLQKLK